MEQRLTKKMEKFIGEEIAKGMQKEAKKIEEKLKKKGIGKRSMHALSESLMSENCEVISKYNPSDRTWEMMLTEFRGADHEDPTKFLQTCDLVLSKFNIPKECWVFIVGNKLTNDAKSWFRTVNEENLSWEEFFQRIEEKFNNGPLVSSLRAKLYGDCQKIGQPIEQFLRRKLALFKRLFPAEDQVSFMISLIDLLEKKYRPYFRVVPTSIEEMIRRANQLEGDLKEEPNTQDVNGQKSEAINNSNRCNTASLICFACGHPGHTSKQCQGN